MKERSFVHVLVFAEPHYFAGNPPPVLLHFACDRYFELDSCLLPPASASCLCLLPLPPALSREYVRPPLTEWLDTN